MFTFLSPAHLVIVIICMAIKGDLRESAIESRPPFQSDGIVGGCHNLMMMLMMTTMIIMIIYNDDDGSDECDDHIDYIQ